MSLASSASHRAPESPTIPMLATYEAVSEHSDSKAVGRGRGADFSWLGIIFPLHVELLQWDNLLCWQSKILKDLVVWPCPSGGNRF